MWLSLQSWTSFNKTNSACLLMHELSVESGNTYQLKKIVEYRPFEKKIKVLILRKFLNKMCRFFIWKYQCLIFLWSCKFLCERKKNLKQYKKTMNTLKSSVSRPFGIVYSKFNTDFQMITLIIFQRFVFTSFHMFEKSAVKFFIAGPVHLA